MRGDLRLVFFRIGLAAERDRTGLRDLFRTVEHHADGAFWFARRLTDEPRGPGDDRKPRGVVDCTGALIPAVQMRAEHDHFARALAAADVRHHVLRGGARIIGRGGGEPQPHLLAELGEPEDLVGVGLRQRE